MYYKIILEAGHMGAGKSFDMVKFIQAESPVDAFEIALLMPGAKKSKSGKNIILIKAISKDDLLEVRKRYRLTLTRKK